MSNAQSGLLPPMDPGLKQRIDALTAQVVALQKALEALTKRVAALEAP